MVLNIARGLQSAVSLFLGADPAFPTFFLVLLLGGLMLLLGQSGLVATRLWKGDRTEFLLSMEQTSIKSKCT